MWGRNLARNLAQLDVLAAVADRHDENAAEFAAQFQSQKCDFDAILAEQNIDGVVIATSAPSHDPLAIAALQAGKHVYVEKPLSLTLAGAIRIADAATKAGRRVMIGHLIRYHAAFRELQAQVSAGAIGTLRHIQANRLRWAAYAIPSLSCLIYVRMTYRSFWHLPAACQTKFIVRAVAI